MHGAQADHNAKEGRRGGKSWSGNEKGGKRGAVTVASGAGRKYPTTEAGGALAWADIGTADKRITWTTTGATNAGEIRVTILYQQNANLA